jgi:hypothetical protein
MSDMHSRVVRKSRQADRHSHWISVSPLSPGTKQNTKFLADNTNTTFTHINHDGMPKGKHMASFRPSSELWRISISEKQVNKASGVKRSVVMKNILLESDDGSPRGRRRKSVAPCLVRSTQRARSSTERRRFRSHAAGSAGWKTLPPLKLRGIVPGVQVTADNERN